MRFEWKLGITKIWDKVARNKGKLGSRWNNYKYEIKLILIRNISGAFELSVRENGEIRRKSKLWEKEK